MITALAIVTCILAGVPALLFLRNLTLYARLPPPVEGRACSVLIPARNEEANIAAALHSILHSGGVHLEVVVLDDGSPDRTVEIVREIARTDPRVRLETALPLPAGWCGKNFA